MMRLRLPVIFLAQLALLGGGCTGEGGATSAAATDSATGPGTSGTETATSTTTGATDSASGSSTTTGGASTGATDSGTATSGGVKLDVASWDIGTTGDTMPGCKKIDLLFSVDNSGSMMAKQQQLANSFPGFVAAIQASLDEVDSYHVGVVTSDAYQFNEPGCQELGDLVTQTDVSGACGPFAEGGRFATEMDTLDTVFPCIAEVGTQGSPLELPISAAIAAVSDAKNQAGGCNEGFLRDDAILVLVVVTDDPPTNMVDDANVGIDTSGWHDAIIAAKGGDEDAAVVIGIMPWDDISCVGGVGGESPNLISFVDSFGANGFKASICEADYSPIFASTIETITTTCENFEPEG